ncbi:hypothetical protein [Paracoccus tegillarcae]|uniref:Sulfotransferase family protein n=1 Tax=Paracoccus tegillarcae TaxID=1529068 RepID=A0A2K9EDZ9_9RHOB|nr:hypothetical protein [Paracoccus tegillarcae]AUH33188.1 hypothetical protein CUV01_07095 [Paracoccus tegillarcae]
MDKKIDKICLVCMDRTGSNMVSQRLNTHPEIIFYNEVFHRQYMIFHDKRVNGDPQTLATRDGKPAAFVSQLWSGAFEPKDELENVKAIGFKLFLNHNAEALKYVVNSDAKLLFLRRRNPLSRFSSFKIAAATNEWKSTVLSKTKKTVQFHPPEFRAYMQNFTSLESLFEMVANRWNRPYFDLWYEDLVKRPEVWDNMCEYLGYPGDAFGESPIVKQNSSDILSRFSNPDVVRDYVSHLGKYEWLSE